MDAAKPAVRTEDSNLVAMPEISTERSVWGLMKIQADVLVKSGMLPSSVKTAEAMKQEILEEARAEHAKMLKNAQLEIARQTDAAMAGIRGEVVAMTVAAAAKIIEKEMNTDVNAKLVTEFIEKLDETKIGGLPC